MSTGWLANRFKGIEEDKQSWRKLVAESFLRKKFENMYRLISPYIKKGARVIDIGMGDGTVAMRLRKGGRRVVGIDVADTSLYKGIRPIVYNGKDIPFGNKKFEVAIILLALHHCQDGLRVLDEAKRVAKRVIVVEDVYRNSTEKWLVSIRDQVCNFEFYQHHYRSVAEWKEIIKKRGWKLTAVKEWSSVVYGVFYGRQVLMVID